MFIDGLASILYACFLEGDRPDQFQSRRNWQSHRQGPQYSAGVAPPQGETIVEVNEKRQNGVAILALKGRLDSNTSGDFEKKLLGMVQQGETRLVLDFSELDYISSAGLRVLLKAVKELKRSDGRLCVCSVKDYIREIFSLSGFLSFLPTHATLEESLRTFATPG
jgi:anti-sigma B factor antagonist